MPTYEVTWTIEVDADSALEAAKLAREMQQDGTEALYFGTRRMSDGVIQDIDLLIETENDTKNF